ncbi:MAG: response regulator [Kofleriaceae bacterium]
MQSPDPAASLTEPIAEPVLAIVDRALLIAIPLLLISILIGRPSTAVIWTVVAGVSLAFVGSLALLGRSGSAPWRGAGYAVVTLAAAILALWTMGPITGVGVMFGLAILLAGAFLSRLQLIGSVLISILAIAYWALSSDGPGTSGTYVVDHTLWFGTALASAIMLWIATKVLTVLVASLELSYRRAAEAYQHETVTRAQLDRSRAELDELAQVELIGRLAGGVAHDINNALSPILFATDALATEVTTPDQRRHLAELEAASHHVADLVRDLMWIGRKFPASTTAMCELGATTRAFQERLERVARRLTVELAIDDDLQLAISPEHLEQVLVGLVVGGHRVGMTRVGVTSAVDQGRAILTLEARERGPTLSTPSREDQVRLYVAAARDLLAQSGSTITSAEGAIGARVKISIALAPVARRAPTNRRILRTALVVEDEPMVLRRLCQLIARQGYEVKAASSVAEALVLLEADPDLLVTDLQLLDGSGEDVAIASFTRNPVRPIIVCSGFNAEDLRRDRLRLAPLTFLAKPFTTAELHAALPHPAQARAAS